MRIDNLNKVSRLYESNSKVKTTKTNSVSKSDQLEISQIGKDYQIAKQAIASIPDVRMDKVNEIKNRMDAGTYQVSSEEVVNKLIKDYFDIIV